MRSSRRPSRRPTTEFWWWAVSLALVVTGVVGLVASTSGPSVGPSINRPLGRTVLTPSQYQNVVGNGTASSHSTGAALVGSTPVELASYAVPARNGSVDASLGARASHPRRAPYVFLRRSRPLHLMIPAIGVSAGVGVLGLNKDGTVQVPATTTVTGWYRFGPAPGQRGSAVILGHVDSYKGPGVFFYLRSLRPGDPVIVSLADHVVVHFKVIGVREYSKNDFPAKLVYGMRRYSALQLVTCGGVFDHATGHYDSNIVVYTVMTGWSRH